MSKKILFLLIFLSLFLGLIFYLAGKNFIEKSLDKDKDKLTEISNPASVYCEKEGGKLEIRKDIKGNEKGFCLFNDGSECEEWDFYYGKCKKGERFCKDLCGDGICQEIVCLAIGCPCSENKTNCPQDCK